MRTFGLLAAILATSVPSLLTAQHTELEKVDIELVLAVDVSGSVSKELRDQQQAAFVEAFRNPDLQNAMLSGPRQRIAVTYFEFSRFGFQSTIVPWMMIAESADFTEFANALERSNPSQFGGDTSISGALLFAEHQLRTNDYQSFKGVVDIAGNGRNNHGPSVGSALERFSGSNTAINVLVTPSAIGKETEDGSANPYAALFEGYDVPMEKYFRDNIVTGPSAFAMVVASETDLVEATLRKLVLEVAWNN